MATIGQWGKTIKFSVNSKKIFTFQDLKRDTGARWATHNIIKKRPRKEYLAPEPQTITMKIVLDARHGVHPRKTLYNIRVASYHGDCNYLYIKGKKFCNHKLYIESVSEAWEEVWNKGELVRASVNITFSEYL